MSAQDGRGPAGAPPVSPASRRRTVAAGLTLVVLLGLVGTLAAHTAGGSTAPARRPPFDPGPLHASGTNGKRVSVRPGIVLYIDDDCPFCAIELGRWSRAVATSHGIDPPTVILSPRSDSSGSHVPAELREGVLQDADGSVARALGVRGVPFRVILDGHATVVAVHVGLTSSARIDSLLNRQPALVQDRDR